MLRFSTRIAFSAVSAIVAAGIVAFADPANAVPFVSDAPVVSIAAVAVPRGPALDVVSGLRADG